MREQSPIFEEDLADPDEQPLELTPEVLESSEPQAPTPLRQRVWFRRAVASFALAGTLTGVASQPNLRMDVAYAAAQTAADFVYEDTPVGWVAQAVDAYAEHKAGWDKPVETTIKTYHDPEHPTPRDAKVTNFVIPGFREMHDEQITQELVKATKHDYPTRYVEYGNQPVTPDSLAELIIKNLNQDPLKTPEIGFTGHSMGGVLILEALARVHEMGYPLPKIAFINFLSTPAGMQTARFSGIASFAVETGIGQKATGLLFTDTLQQMNAQHFHPSWYLHDTAKAWRDIPKGASDALTRSQLKDLKEIGDLQALHALMMSLKGVITHETKVTYFGPEDPTSDNVVDDLASFNDYWREFQDDYGISIRYVWWGSGHANPDFSSNSRADKQLNLSMEPRISPKPISPITIPGITGPKPTTSVTVAPSRPPAIAAGEPAPTEKPSPAPTPTPTASLSPAG